MIYPYVALLRYTERLVFFILLLSVALHAQPVTGPGALDSHVVGTILGKPGTSADHDFRTDVDLMALVDFAFLPGGDMLALDTGHARIFRVHADGLVRVFAGSGKLTKTGDGGPATEAGLHDMRWMAVDAAGQVYLAEQTRATTDVTGVIRRIGANGYIETIAGNQKPGCPVLGAHALQSPLGHMQALAVDPDGAVYFASWSCPRLYRISPEGVIGIAGVPDSSAVEGSATEQPLVSKAVNFTFGPPHVQVRSIAVAENGDVWATSEGTGYGELLRVTASGLVYRFPAVAFATTREGPIEQVTFTRILSIAARAGGGLVLSQYSGTIGPTSRNEIGIIDEHNNYSILMAQDGFDGKQLLQFAGQYIALGLVREDPHGQLYVTAAPGQSILRLEQNREFSLFFHRFDAAALATGPELGPAKFRWSSQATPVADSAGNIYIGDSELRKIFRLTPEGALQHVAGNGYPYGDEDGVPALQTGASPRGALHIDTQGRIYFAMQYWRGGFHIRRFTVGGMMENVLGGGTSTTDIPIEGGVATQLRLTNQPTWTVSPAGEVYFRSAAYPGNAGNVVWRVKADGTVTRVLGQVNARSDDPVGKSALDTALPYDLHTSYLTFDRSGVFVYGAQGIGPAYFIDEQGIVRQAMRHWSITSPEEWVFSGPSTDVLPPSSTPTASWSPRTLIGVPAHYPAWLEYTIGGTTRVLANQFDGLPRQDGAYLRDGRSIGVSNLLALPDGGVAWVATQEGASALRRTFPIPAGCAYTGLTDELDVAGSASTINVNLTTGPQCPWTLGTSAHWLQVTSPSYTGKGSTQVSLQIPENPSPLERTATLRIAGKSIRVRQASSTRQDLLFVSPSAATLPADGGTLQVSILASPQRNWQVAVPTPGVVVNGATSGVGSSTVSFVVGALSPDPQQRELVVTIGGQPIRIKQVRQHVERTVPVTISSNDSNARVSVDLVEYQLPATFQWAPGSTHHLTAPEFREVSDGHLLRFLRWDDQNASSLTYSFTTPETASALQVRYANLHRIIAKGARAPLGNTEAIPVFSHRGVEVPQTYRPAISTGTIAWYPEGFRLGVFAPNWMPLRFQTFDGLISGPANPTSFVVKGAGEISATYLSDRYEYSPLRVGYIPPWQFGNASRSAAPAQLSLDVVTDAAALPFSTFVAYAAPAPLPELAQPTATDWLNLRRPLHGEPLTFELNLIPEQATAANAGATLYVHRPDTTTERATVGYLERPPLQQAKPWIGAITDAGGFRQMVTSESTRRNAASGMIITLFGKDLASSSDVATTLPLPTVLGGVSVEYQVGMGSEWRPMPLFFVSPQQINAQLPAGLQTRSDLTIRVLHGSEVIEAPYPLTVLDRVPSLFSANSSGAGAPAGFYIRVRPDGQQERGPLFQCVAEGCTPAPLPRGGENDELYLELYGTGFANAGKPEERRVYVNGVEATIAHAGSHADFVGLDQLNVKVPKGLPSGEPLDVYLWVRDESAPWIASNRLTIRLQ